MSEQEKQAIRRRTAELIRLGKNDVASRIAIICALVEEFGIGYDAAFGWWRSTRARGRRKPCEL